MSIVVLEAGAAWPAWLTEYQRLAPNAVVIAQASAESVDAFQQRVLHRVEEASAHGGARVRAGVIVCTDSPEQKRSTLRQNIARGLLKAMGTGREAEVVLGGDSEELEASRHELFALAGTLCEELGGTQVSVRVADFEQQKWCDALGLALESGRRTIHFQSLTRGFASDRPECGSLSHAVWRFVARSKEDAAASLGKLRVDARSPRGGRLLGGSS